MNLNYSDLGLVLITLYCKTVGSVSGISHLFPCKTWVIFLQNFVSQKSGSSYVMHLDFWDFLGKKYLSYSKITQETYLDIWGAKLILQVNSYSTLA